MQFKQGAKVYTSDGEQVGTIVRIVIDPNPTEVTHLVIQKGFLFTQDKVIPVNQVGLDTEERVTLRENAGELENFPDFQESYFIAAEGGNRSRQDPEQRIRTVYWYPPVGEFDGYVHSVPPYVVKTKNIPAGTVAIAEGANVISSDGEYVGDIERIFTHADDERATHFLISAGLFLKEKKLIPTHWVTNVFEHEIHISVDSGLVKQLPEYQIQD